MQRQEGIPRVERVSERETQGLLTPDDPVVAMWNAAKKTSRLRVWLVLRNKTLPFCFSPADCISNPVLAWWLRFDWAVLPLCTALYAHDTSTCCRGIHLDPKQEGIAEYIKELACANYKHIKYSLWRHAKDYTFQGLPFRLP